MSKFTHSISLNVRTNGPGEWHAVWTMMTKIIETLGNRYTVHLTSADLSIEEVDEEEEPDSADQA